MTSTETQIILKDKRAIRVFISSTFRDMQAERDILIKKVFPQLRKMCEKRAVSWTEVDLRWGITTEEASEGKVLPLCLAEIQRCRPYFIGILGERYGWIPEQKEIPDDLLETQPWLKECGEHSVTELEILHGVLRDPAMAGHSIFYFRDPDYLRHLPEGADPADFTAESSAASAKLADLKNRIRSEHAAGRLFYSPRENYSDPKTLGDLVLADFTAIIEQLYPMRDVPDALDQETMRHEAYAQSRRLAFIGRNDLLGKINEHVTGAGLVGESGCGKSAILAEWASQWREQNSRDLIIQHYIGSTQESANWQGLVLRILGELKRAFDIADNLPMQPDALRTALQDWLTKAAGNRRVVLVLDAINQLSIDDPAAQQLGWLPSRFPANIKLLVSSPNGKPLEPLKRRNWPELNVPPFNQSHIVAASEAYLHIFSKKLPRDMLKKLENTPAAANALYLRSVLDELRQFGKYEELKAKADDYLTAQDLPALFDRILTRWHDDFGKDNEHADLVRRSLCLIACTRFGLSEGELLDLLGKNDEPLPRRCWSPLYLAAENSLAQRSGLLAFGHDHLRSAVQQRWLKEDINIQPFRLHLADYFSNILMPSDRKLDELPALLSGTAQWEQLKKYLADIPTFLRLQNRERWKWELHGFWLEQKGRFDPVEVYLQSINAVESYLTKERFAYLLSEAAAFHMEAGRYAAAETLIRRALEVNERLRGKDHPNTLISANILAELLRRKGDYASAEPLYRRTLNTQERVLGNDHPDTLTSVNNLALLFANKGDDAGAELLYRRALEARERLLGKEHPDTLNSLNNLAGLVKRKKDYEMAEQMYRRVLDSRERLLGEEHPDTLTSVNNLATVLFEKGDYVGAEPLFRRALEFSGRVLGKEHPATLKILGNLAALFYSKGDRSGAITLYQCAVVGLFRHSHEVGHKNPLFDTMLGIYVTLLKQTGMSQDQAIVETGKLLAVAQTLESI